MVTFQDGRKSVVGYQKDSCWEQNYVMSVSLCINDLTKGIHSEILHGKSL